MKYKSASPNKLQILILWIIARITVKNGFIARKLVSIGELANFQQWVNQNFPDSKLFVKREPSLASYLYLKPTLKIDDILYFDEAFDIGERTVIIDYLLRDFDCKSLGHTYHAITLQIIGIRK